MHGFVAAFGGGGEVVERIVKREPDEGKADRGVNIVEFGTGAGGVPSADIQGVTDPQGGGRIMIDGQRGII